MNAKEAKIIQEAGIGHLIKKIRKLIERNDYTQYGEMYTFDSLTENQINALKELGYTVDIRHTVGWYDIW